MMTITYAAAAYIKKEFHLFSNKYFQNILGICFHLRTYIVHGKHVSNLNCYKNNGNKWDIFIVLHNVKVTSYFI